MKATLTYHSIDDSGSAISLSASAFAAHLQWLTSGRVRVLALDDLVRHPDEGEDAVAVTFDDGFLNTKDPVERLLAHHIPVTIFAVSGHVGGTNAWGARAHRGIPTLPLLTWGHLEDLAARGASVAAHTRSHAALTTLSSDAIDDELQGCAEEIQARLGVRSAHFAYPYGDVDDAVAARAARCFEWAHTVEFDFVKSHDEPTRLPRLDAFYFSAPGALEAWGSPRFLRRVAWCRARRWVRARLLGR